MVKATFNQVVSLQDFSAPLTGFSARSSPTGATITDFLSGEFPGVDVLSAISRLPLADELLSQQPSGYCVAGYGGISLAVEGPSKVDIQTEDLEDGTCKVSYFPTVPGVYIVSTKFADEHVPGMCGPL